MDPHFSRASPLDDETRFFFFFFYFFEKNHLKNGFYSCHLFLLFFLKGKQNKK